MAGYGFRRDLANARLNIEVAGSVALRGTSSGITIIDDLTVDAGGVIITAGTFTAAALGVAVAALADDPTPLYAGGSFEASADLNTIGAPLMLFRIVTAGTAAGESIDVTMTHAIRVLSFWAVNAAIGGAGDTVQLLNGANAISNALDMNTADRTVTRAGTIDETYHEIAAAGTLRITEANGANNQIVDCYVLAARI
jgi:hypothetical protein